MLLAIATREVGVVLGVRGPAACRSRRVRRGVPRRTRGSSPTAGTGSRDRRVRRRPTTAPPGRANSSNTASAVDRSARAHRLGRVRGCTPREHRQARQQSLFGFGAAARRTSRSRPATSGGVAPPGAAHRRGSRSVGRDPRASSAGLIAVTRAAASSIANGTPSRRRHTCTTAAAFSGVEREVGVRTAARVPRTAAPRPHAATRRGRRRRPARPTTAPHDLLTVERQALAARRQHHHARDTNARSTSTRSATASRRCSQLSTTNSSCLVRKNSTSDSSRL